jgi:hypothetical protein
VATGGRMNTLTSTEAAARLSIKPGTLRLWRMLGKGPAYIRYGGPRGRAVYLDSAIEEFLRGRSFTSTAQETARGAEAGR